MASARVGDVAEEVLGFLAGKHTYFARAHERCGHSPAELASHLRSDREGERSVDVEGPRKDGIQTKAANRGRVGVVGVFGALVFGSGLGCASSTQPAVSAAVRELHDVDCPDDRVHVLETRDAGGDTIYVVDACGKKLEITKGYAVPERNSQLSEYSAESGFEFPERMQRTVPADVTEIVRTKVQRWCRPSSAEGNPGEIVFYADSLDECRARLRGALTPFGTEPGNHGEPDVYWFGIGKYVFTVHQSFSSKSAPAKQVAAKTTPTSKRDARVWYARVELGGGYLDTSRPSTAGGSFHIRPQFGVKVIPNLAFGLATANHIAFSDDIPILYEAGLVTTYYPFPKEGLRLEATVSGSWLRFADTDYAEGGPLFSAAIGFDDFARRKKAGDTMSDACVSIRGFYATAPDDDAVSVAFYLGWFWW
jgi:hypothetical protein